MYKVHTLITKYTKKILVCVSRSKVFFKPRDNTQSVFYYLHCFCHPDLYDIYSCGQFRAAPTAKGNRVNILEPDHTVSGKSILVHEKWAFDIPTK